MPTIITIANQKGGVGKTTTCVTLAHGLARQGRRTLVVDLDSQGNVADSLGLEAGADLYQVLMPGLGRPLKEVITASGRKNLDVVRSDKNTVGLKQALAGVDFREYVLMDALDKADYDLVLCDCAPSVDLLQTAALVAADYLLIPTRLDQLAIKGVRDVLQTLAALQRARRSSCELGGIIPTFYDRVTKESHEQLIHLAQTFRQKLLPPIPVDTQCRVATRHGQTLWEYAPDARALRGMTEKGDKLLGGYVQVMERLGEVLK